MKEVQELVGIVPWTFVAQICNLFLTVFLVKKFLFDRINKVVEERKQMADSQIADATKAKEEAKTMRDQYEASISNAKDEARQIISDAQKSATERGEAIVADAKKEAVAIKEKASADIAKERTAAFQQMKSEIGDIAVSIAGKVIEKEVKEADHQKLIDEFILMKIQITLGCCRSHLFQEKQDLDLLIRHLARRLMSIL